MEKYILDTCTWIEWFQQRNGVPEHVRSAKRQNLYVSEVTLAELTFGAYNSDEYERHIKEPDFLRMTTNVLPISDVFEEYAMIRCALKKVKRTLDKEIGNFDILIGATALHYGLTVVTDNVKHFEAMPGINVVNWIERG
ncbi:MAG: PIN domain-containing protein [Muribaculaceae bacterium]|nr:PIN domain-containing protein [Muribaculaceae bacterium]